MPMETTTVQEKLRPIPPFSWVPPEWGATKPILEDFGELPNDLVPQTLNCITSLRPPLQTLKDLGENYASALVKVSADRDEEDEIDQEDGTNLELLPHPGSDFRHDDPTDPPAGADPTGRGMTPASSDGSSVLFPKGLPRLKLVFEYALCKVTTYLGQLNAALDVKDDNAAREAYNAARKAYMELLQDLDDHEPPDELIIPGKSGYGRSLKWFYVTPFIKDGKIQGASVEGKWNPHFSSSGIPIPH